MSTRSRTPRYFPTMKVRGARRRRVAPWQRVLRGFDQLTVAVVGAGAALKSASLVVRRASEGQKLDAQEES